MKPISVGLLALTAIVALSIILQVRTNQMNRAEIAALRAELDIAQRKSTTLRARSGFAGQSTAAKGINVDQELPKLREEVANLRIQVKEIAGSPNHWAEEATTIPVELVPSAEWKNSGRETPSRSIETFYWAALAGEVKTLADSIVIPEVDRAKVDAWFTSLSGSTRQQYGSPENLLGLLMAKDAGPLTGMQILGQHQINDADVLMQIRFSTDGGDIEDAPYLLRRTSQGWRVVVDAGSIDVFARHLREAK